MPKRQIGEILLAKGYLSEQQLDEALSIQSKAEPHRPIGEILVEQGFVTETHLHLCLLLDLVARINSTTDLQSLLSAIMDAAREVLSSEASSLIIRDPDSEELIIAVPTGPAESEISGVRIPAGQGFCGWVVEHAEPLVVERVDEDPRFYKDISKSTDFQTRSLVCVPLKNSQGHIIGALQAINRRDGKNFTPQDLPLFSVLGDQAAIALERARLQQESLEKKLLEKELELACQIQKGFWPKELPDYQGIDLAAMSLPATHVGGDYYDFIPLQGSQCALVVGDVSGKGPPAALLMATLRAMLRAQIENQHSVEDTISLVNNALVKDSPLEKFVTLFFGVLDAAALTFTYVNAGHNPPLLYDLGNGEIKELTSGGPIIGFRENLPFVAACEPLHPGHVLVMFSDGVTEAHNSSDELFGDDRLHELIRQHASKDAQELMGHIYGSVTEYAGAAPQFDDMTLLVMKVEETCSP